MEASALPSTRGPSDMRSQTLSRAEKVLQRQALFGPLVFSHSIDLLSVNRTRRTSKLLWTRNICSTTCFPAKADLYFKWQVIKCALSEVHSARLPCVQTIGQSSLVPLADQIRSATLAPDASKACAQDGRQVASAVTQPLDVLGICLAPADTRTSPSPKGLDIPHPTPGFVALPRMIISLTIPIPPQDRPCDQGSG